MTPDAKYELLRDWKRWLQETDYGRYAKPVRHSAARAHIPGAYSAPPALHQAAVGRVCLRLQQLGWTAKEIAIGMGLKTPGTVFTRISLARRSQRINQMAKMYFEWVPHLRADD